MFPFKPNKQYTVIAICAGAVIAAVILLGVLLFNIGTVIAGISSFFSVLSPIFYALVIAYLMNPLVARFERLYTKKRGAKKEDIPEPGNAARILAIFSAFLLLFAIVLAFVLFVLPLLVGDGEMLMSRLLTVAERVTVLVNTLGEPFGISISVEQLYGFLGGFTNMIANSIFGIGKSLTLMLFNILVGLCLSTGILYHRRTLLGAVRHAGAAICSLRVFRYLERISYYSNRVFGKYLIGKIVECAIIGLLYLIILPLLGVPYPFLITVIMTITNFIPIIGAILGGIPSAVLILTGDDPLLTIWFAIIVLAVEQIDGNIIFPKVIGSIIELRAVWIMVAVALFGGFFGIVGMFLSPPLFAILYTLIRDFTDHRLAKKGYPIETDLYVDKFASTAPPRRHHLKRRPEQKREAKNEKGGNEK